MHSLPVFVRSLQERAMFAVLLAGLTMSTYAGGQTSASLEGFWLEPSGGIIHVATCGTKLCATLMAFSRADGATLDVKNADPKLRNRSLCGLQLGSGFAGVDEQRAEGGQIYDPKTGKTYSAAMTLDGDTLRLRGYVGVKLFGKTEVWKRVGEPSAPCRPS